MIGQVHLLYNIDIILNTNCYLYLFSVTTFSIFYTTMESLQHVLLLWLPVYSSTSGVYIVSS